jgi:hypothetical protein
MLIVGAHNERAAPYRTKRHFERSRKIWLNIQHFKHPDFSTTSFRKSSKIPVEMTGPREGEVNSLESNIFIKAPSRRLCISSSVEVTDFKERGGILPREASF